MRRLNLYFPYILLGVVIGVILWSNWPGHTESIAHTPTPMCPLCMMEVDPSTSPRLQRGGKTYYFCSSGCREQFARRPDHPADQAETTRLVDVVCKMEVNSAWGIISEFEGKTYHFCNEQCRRAFAADPEHYLTDRCLVCSKSLGDAPSFEATYLGTTYQLCSEAHRTEFKRDPASYFMHTMWGIPNWLYYASIALVLMVSFGVFDWMGRKEAEKPLGKPTAPRLSVDDIRGEGERLLGRGSRAVRPGPSSAIALRVLPAAIAGRVRAAADSDRFDLLSVHWIRAAFRSRLFRFALQFVVTALFVLIIAAGLFGNQNPALNIAPILTWTVWWGLLIILIMFAGKSWCYVCPWDAIAGWTEKLAFWRKTDDGLSLNLKWPRAVRNIAIATILFVGLTWVELGFGVTMKPRITAYLALGMLLMAVVVALTFEKKSFCRYACLVGRVSGLYALFASTEIRSKSAAKCRSCDTKECVKGSESAYGCPTFLYPGKLSANTYCIQCMECIQACPHDNLALNLRPWGADLVAEGKPRADEAYLALLMLAITGFHGLTMTPNWARFVEAIRDHAGLGRILGFSIGMAILMLGPVAIYAVLVATSQWLGSRGGQVSLGYRDYFIRYAYALLPIALFYHIAHNLEHLLMEGPKVAAMISDPMGWGWNLLGTATWTIPPLISLDKLWLVQVLLVLVGHVYSLWVAQKVSLRLFGSSKAAFRSQLPMLIGMIAFSVFSLWLLKQPMEMRTSAM